MIDAVNTTIETKYPYRWVILGVLWITYIVVFLNRLSVGPLSPFFKEEFQLTSAQVGFVVSAAALGYLMPQIPVGWVVDRIGARWPLAMGEFIAAGAMFALFFVKAYPALLALMFITGAGCGFLTPSTTQGVVVWFPQNERATVMGFKQTAVNLGGMIGAATLPAIALTFGWRYGFLVLGLTAAAVGLATVVFYREPPLSASERSASVVARATLIDVLANRQIWLVALAGGCLNWVEMAMIAHFILYLTKSLHFAVVAAGGLLAMAEGVGALARPISGFASDRLFGGRRTPVFIGFAVMASAMCLLLGLAGPHLGWLLYPAVFVLGIGAIGFGGVYLTLLSEFGGRGGAAKAAALGSTIGASGSIIGPPTFGHIVDITGSYDLAWLSLALVGVVCVTLLSLVRESERKI